MRALCAALFFWFVAHPALARTKELLLEKVRDMPDPQIHPLLDTDQGDRRGSDGCSLRDGTTISITREARERTEDTLLAVRRNGMERTIRVENTGGTKRSTLVCDERQDRFYYGNPRQGHLSAYSARRLFRDADPVLWKTSLTPFRSKDEVDSLLDASVLVSLQERQGLVLVEWFYRERGKSWFHHMVLDQGGATVAKLGPSDLLLDPDARDPWFVLFAGGGTDLVNYVPRSMVRLRLGVASEAVRPATEVLPSLTANVENRVFYPPRDSGQPVLDHLVALLTPNRSARVWGIEFCPIVPAERARTWLGPAYDELIANLARDLLLRFWSELGGSDPRGNPLDAWFRTEIAPREPMREVLARFDPLRDEWIVEYQTALRRLGAPAFERLLSTYGSVLGVTREESGPAK